MSANDDVDGAVSQPGQRCLNFLGVAKTTEFSDLDWPVSKSTAHGLVVLLCQQRGWDQNGHLLAIRNRNKRGAQGDFRLAKTDITTNQAVHGLSRYQILNRCMNGGQLIGRFLEAKSLGKRFVSLGIEGKGMAASGGPTSIEIQQFGSRITSLSGCFTSSFFPLP